MGQLVASAQNFGVWSLVVGLDRLCVSYEEEDTCVI
jgi:hypothetical protein